MDNVQQYLVLLQILLIDGLTVFEDGLMASSCIGILPMNTVNIMKFEFFSYRFHDDAACTFSKQRVA